MNNFFKIASLVRQADEKKGNFKNIILQQSKGSNYKALYASVIKTLKVLPKIKEFLSEIKPKQKIRNIYLFAVQVNEYFNNPKAKIGGAIQRLIKTYESQLKAIIPSQENNFIKKEVYFRVREQFSKETQFESYEKDPLVPHLFKANYEDYQKLVSKIQEDKDLEKKIIIQGKSSCLTPYFLFQDLIKKNEKVKNINQGSMDVIDCCAAPGNKTLQLSEYINNGKVFAFELNQKRFELLSRRMNQYEAKNVTPIMGDFLEVDVNQKQFANVKYIMADPSCSGSGMLNNFFFESKEKKNPDRLQNLAKFQSSIVLHAMKFPSVERVAYSTCSIHEEENELVVKKVLDKNPSFELVNISQEWNSLKGSEKFVTHGDYTVKTDPKTDGIDGFFVAVFQKKKQ